jgi:hypothetical protein
MSNVRRLEVFDMTIARKHTRPLSVDGVQYRWMLKETDYGALFELLLVVEAEEYRNGEQLVAHIEAPNRRENDAVTPSVVAELIRVARKSGWDPTRPGSRPVCDEVFRQLIQSRSHLG